MQDYRFPSHAAVMQAILDNVLKEGANIEINGRDAVVVRSMGVVTVRYQGSTPSDQLLPRVNDGRKYLRSNNTLRATRSIG